MKQNRKHNSLSLCRLRHVLCFLTWMTSLPMTSRAQSDVVVRRSEEEAVGSQVLDLRQYPQLFSEVAPEQRPKLTFNILDQQSPTASYFAMAASTGLLTIAKRIDREQVCPTRSDQCSLKFSVAITGTAGLSFSNIALLQVDIDDINDNPPSFAEYSVTVEISEGAKVGTQLKLNGPRDLDSLPNNTVQRVVLSASQQPSIFDLSFAKNPDGTSFVYLTLTTALDRETVGHYDFNITAYDGGSEPKSAIQRVQVVVTDDNDNAPVFQQASYDVSVRQDDPLGTEVVKVTATDKDAGQFGTVSYRFSSVLSDTARRLFAINETTGQITLLARPTPTSTPYSLIVEAYDGGSPPAVQQVVVNVAVLNTGNNPPRVRLVTVEGATSEIPVQESAPLDSLVAFVTVDDADSGDNGRVTCSMVNGAGQFRLAELLTNKGYRMLLAAPLDRELVSSYQGSILCRDGGVPSLSAQVEFTVVVTDINDNSPWFEQATFSASITENNVVGQFVVQVSATDRDAGNNSRLTYGFLEPEALTYLSIHPQTGVVSARVVLDREMTAVLRYTVQATDGGEPPRTGSAGLIVTIRDLNDNVPQLLGTPYQFRVSEGVSPGQIVGKMSATDPDEGNNGMVEFFFAGSISGDVPFSVHTNGSIQVVGVLDREASDTHVFTVLARDKGDIPRSNSTQVTILVTDINDNAPVILFPISINHSVVITTPPENGIILGRIIAYDVDQGNASSLVFSLEQAGGESGVFAVEPDSGKISLADVTKLKNPYIYHVVLKVHDKGVPPLSAQTSLQIEVNYPNLTLGGNPGSGQQTGSEDPSRDTYVVIVAVIGGGTAVLSGIIIAAICIVLRQERRRKARDNCAVMKNEYVPAPTRVTSPEKMAPQKVFPSSPPAAERRGSMSEFSHHDFSSAGVVLSPKGLPPQQGGPGGSGMEMQKKVSFSLDEPDADVHQMQARDALRSGGQQSEAWKRLASPDDINSDTSGDSGTCDSGRGASDDDIHLDSSMDKHAANNQRASPPLTNTNRTPAPSNIYTAPAFSSFRQGQGRHAQEQYGAPQGQGQGQAGRSRFAPQGGSYHEGRADNFRGKGGVGRIQPPPRGGQTPRPAPQTVSLHPEADSSWQSHQTHQSPPPPPPPQHQRAPQQQVRGSHQSLDFVEGHSGGYQDRYASAGRDGSNRWLLQSPRPASSMSFQRQGSILSGDERDDASTTTSGSYTISPEELRLDGMLSPDIIV